MRVFRLNYSIPDHHLALPARSAILLIVHAERRTIAGLFKPAFLLSVLDTMPTLPC